MRLFSLIIVFFFSVVAHSQNEQLAQNYYEKGEFEKAVLSYEELLSKQPGNNIYYNRLIDCYQQLLQFEKADKTIQERIKSTQMAHWYVELGYNFQLQKNTEKATQNYQLAIQKIQENVSNVYGVANAFERKVLLDYALQAY